MKSSPRVGDQLELQLLGVLPITALPWGGRRPRGLTRVALSVILKAQAGKSVSGDGDPMQYDLWLPMKKAPWIYQGAPLLSEPEVGDG